MWHHYFGEVDLGARKIRIDQSSFNWNLAARTAPDYQAMVHKWSGSNNLIGQLSDEAGLCARDNRDTYDRVTAVSNEILAVAAPLRAARLRLIADLLQWEDFAARDGWPIRQDELSFKAISDRLWMTSAPEDRGPPRRTARNREGPTIVVISPVPHIASRESSLTDPRADMSHASPEWRATDAFLLEHDDCALWKPTASKGVYLTASRKPIVGEPFSVEPSVADDLGVAAGGHLVGPYATPSIDRSFTNEIDLSLDLFEPVKQETEAFFSGADSNERP